MIRVRVSFLLMLVPVVAAADVSAPEKASPAPKQLEYWKGDDGKVVGSQAPVTLDVGGRAVTVAFGADFKIHVRVRDGGELAVEPAGQGFLSRKGGNASVALFSRGPVPLVRIDSRPEACSDYWEIYVSVVDGVPREALSMNGIADPPAMSTPSVKFAGDGAVVTTRTSEDEDGKKVRVERKRYRFDGRVYAPVSKRASAVSK